MAEERIKLEAELSLQSQYPLWLKIVVLAAVSILIIGLFIAIYRCLFKYCVHQKALSIAK
jgi:hypothetical protein